MEIKTNNENGYNLHFIETKNFKTTFIKVIFWEKIKKEELVFRNMLINNLLFSSKTYNTQKKMNIKKPLLSNSLSHTLGLERTSKKKSSTFFLRPFSEYLSSINDKLISLKI